jgi:hypothetical protein
MSGFDRSLNCTRLRGVVSDVTLRVLSLGVVGSMAESTDLTEFMEPSGFWELSGDARPESKPELPPTSASLILSCGVGEILILGVRK